MPIYSKSNFVVGSKPKGFLVASQSNGNDAFYVLGNNDKDVNHTTTDCGGFGATLEWTDSNIFLHSLINPSVRADIVQGFQSDGKRTSISFPSTIGCIPSCSGD